MITHVVTYKPRRSGIYYAKLFHSLALAEKWIELHGNNYVSWVLNAIEEFDFETREAKYKVLKNSESEEI